jgi:DNA-binding MarR family transcriptional regulator
MVDPVAEVEAAMVAIRRRQARRMFAREAGVQDVSGQQVIDALDAAGDELIGVNGVADALGVDQPRASKLVAAAVAAGLVRREADQQDGRRTNLVLTDAGRDRVETVKTFRRRRFATAMSDWPEADQETFAVLFSRFVAALEKPE